MIRLQWESTSTAQFIQYPVAVTGMRILWNTTHGMGFPFDDEDGGKDHQPGDNQCLRALQQHH